MAGAYTGGPCRHDLATITTHVFAEVLEHDGHVKVLEVEPYTLQVDDLRGWGGMGGGGGVGGGAGSFECVTRGWACRVVSQPTNSHAKAQGGGGGMVAGWFREGGG